MLAIILILVSGAAFGAAAGLAGLALADHRRHGAPVTNRLMARCRICGSREDVISYDPRGLWAYPFRRTWCPEHCPDHDYVYSRWDRHYCNNCGEHPPAEWFAERFD